MSVLKEFVEHVIDMEQLHGRPDINIMDNFDVSTIRIIDYITKSTAPVPDVDFTISGEMHAELAKFCEYFRTGILSYVDSIGGICDYILYSICQWIMMVEIKKCYASLPTKDQHQWFFDWKLSEFAFPYLTISDISHRLHDIINIYILATYTTMRIYSPSTVIKWYNYISPIRRILGLNIQKQANESYYNISYPMVMKYIIPVFWQTFCDKLFRVDETYKFKKIEEIYTKINEVMGIEIKYLILASRVHKYYFADSATKEHILMSILERTRKYEIFIDICNIAIAKSKKKMN